MTTTRGRSSAGWTWHRWRGTGRINEGCLKLMAKPEDDNEKYERERDIAVIKKHIQRRLSQTTKKIQVLQPTSRWEDVSWLRYIDRSVIEKSKSRFFTGV